jgi:hypothetical protein
VKQVSKDAVPEIAAISCNEPLLVRNARERRCI